jgi:hypothetical protein
LYRPGIRRIHVDGRARRSPTQKGRLPQNVRAANIISQAAQSDRPGAAKTADGAAFYDWESGRPMRRGETVGLGGPPNGGRAEFTGLSHF